MPTEHQKKPKPAKLIAEGVKIASGAQFALPTVGSKQLTSGAQFNFTALANKRLATGTVFTAVSNTAATPISGTFANLADGSTLTAGPNNLLVSYHGGDGNDLTLTVQ